MALYVNLVEEGVRYPLADIERTAMQAIRSLAQKHLGQMGVVASAFDPLTFITDEMQAEYLSLAYLLWQQLDDLTVGFGLDFLPIQHFFPLVKDAIESSANFYVQALTSIIGKQAEKTPVFGEFFIIPDYIPGTLPRLSPPQEYLVQFGDIRSVLGALGGGSGGQVPLATGITGGVTFSEVLAANNIEHADKLWLYGEAVRRTFNGHLQMDGLVFSDWNDDALNISPQDRWLRIPKYRPGDHWGCACVVVPYVPNFGEGIPMTLEATVASGYNPGQPRDREGRWTSHRSSITSLAAESIERVWGGGPEALFGVSLSTAPTPWPRLPKVKGKRPYDPDLITQALKDPTTEPVDPRLLWSTQPNLVRQHFDFYYSGEGRGTNRVAADAEQTANRQPIVYVDSRGRHILLSGHHRAAAALAHGEDLNALVVREQPSATSEPST